MQNEYGIGSYFVIAFLFLLATAFTAPLFFLMKSRGLKARTCWILLFVASFMAAHANIIYVLLFVEGLDWSLVTSSPFFDFWVLPLSVLLFAWQLCLGWVIKKLFTYKNNKTLFPFVLFRLTHTFRRR